MSDTQKMKDNARSYLNVYIQRGIITKQPCRECGSYAEAHHPDYSKPLDVIWLCRKHHMELHRTIGFVPKEDSVLKENSVQITLDF